jgi:RNase P subunit RPR2
MKAMFEVRIDDLGPGDFVSVECLACGHSERLTGAMFKTAGVADYMRITTLSQRFRCRECDAKGRVDVTIRWAE